MYDMHIHTKNSKDSKQTIDEVCLSAIAKNLSGIAICDHVDMWFLERDNTEKNLENCVMDVKRARETYGDRLKILQGVELAEYLYDEKKAESIKNRYDYDVILGSVHTLLYEDWDNSYSRLDFSENLADELKIKGFLKEYFKKVYEMALYADFDVLTHINCPLRYINGMYNRNIDCMEFKDEIHEILKLIISKNIALEINTNGIGKSFNETLPNTDIIKMYYKMGGRLITLASDAHIPCDVANGFDKVGKILKDIGFRDCFYFEKREAKHFILL